MENVYQQLKSKLGERLKENVILAPFTTFKIGGPADYFYEAKTREEFIEVIKLSRELKIPLTILGGGTNILIGDKGIRGLVVKNTSNKISIKGVEGKLIQGKSEKLVYVEAESGVNFNQLVRFTAEEGLSGLEMHLGLPGTVGGAIYMNSKWTRGLSQNHSDDSGLQPLVPHSSELRPNPVSYVGDAVYQAVVMTPDDELKTVSQNYFHFAYDTSILQKNKDILISVIFILKSAPKEKLWEIANQSMSYRRETQPQGVFTAGCVFRNLSTVEAMTAATPNQTTSAGFLIDHAGFKGKVSGEAQISTSHANFIINRGFAKASDVVKLIETARVGVQAQFGVKLIEEIVRLGEF